MRLVIAFWGSVLAAFLGFIGYAIYDDVTSDKFELRKDSWDCTKSHTDLTVQPVITGYTTTLVFIPKAECDQWSRK